MLRVTQLSGFGIQGSSAVTLGKVLAGSGSYVLVGSTAGIVKTAAPAKTLAAAAGSYSLTGTAASLTKVGVWLPSSLSTLKLWLKGEDNTGSDGTDITTWTDASGQGNNGTGAGNVPTVKAADLNGRNVVRFDASSGGDYFTFSNFLTGFSAGSLLLVIKLVTDATTNQKDGLHKFGGSSSDTHFTYNGDGNWYDDFGSDTRRSIGNPTPSLAAWNIYSGHSGSNDLRFYLNGVNQYTSASNTVTWPTAPKLGKSISFGMDGWIAEAVFVNEVLSTGDRQKLEGYFAHKWGITSVLDSGHPYKTTPP